MLLHLGLNGLTSLPSIHLATCTEDDVHTWRLQPQVILNRMEEARELSGRQANTSNDVFGIILLIGLYAMWTYGKKANEVGFSMG
jgi:hypothetical protein